MTGHISFKMKYIVLLDTVIAVIKIEKKNWFFHSPISKDSPMYIYVRSIASLARIVLVLDILAIVI